MDNLDHKVAAYFGFQMFHARFIHWMRRIIPWKMQCKSYQNVFQSGFLVNWAPIRSPNTMYTFIYGYRKARCLDSRSSLDWSVSFPSAKGLARSSKMDHLDKHVELHMSLSENRVYSQWNSHLIGIMIINHWVWGYTIFRQTHMDWIHFHSKTWARNVLEIACWSWKTCWLVGYIPVFGTSHPCFIHKYMFFFPQLNIQGFKDVKIMGISWNIPGLVICYIAMV